MNKMNKIMRAIAILLTTAFIVSHSPRTWATPAQKAPIERSQRANTQAAGTPGQQGSPLSEERRKRLIEREKKNGDAEDYEGGVAIYIGGGVLIVALIIVAILVVD